MVYLTARGRGMVERSQREVRDVEKAQADYIRNVVGATPAQEIAHAKQLLDAGAISAEEFETLKAKALA